MTSENDHGVWVEDASGMRLVIREGEVAPGTTMPFLFGDLDWALNDAGYVALRARLLDAPLAGTGIWLASPDAIRLVALSGDPAPETSAGVEFSSVGVPAINSAGQVAFFAGLAGPGVSGFNTGGVWATDTAGTLGLVLRRGDIVEVAPDELRRVEGIQFATKHAASSAQTGFNDAGELAFAVRFTDQSEAILVATPIAPGDIDLDGDVDLADYLALEACLSGPGNPAAEDCERCDFDDDNDVDLSDLVAFQALFTGTR